jgi:7,8-dihydropterin-6-yl-methyl-4-(beta-D-ribofuranosyl)aminobenzene 5'-phosphate synthase
MCRPTLEKHRIKQRVKRRRSTMDAVHINEVERVEILTLVDNYIDAVVSDDSAVVTRANTLRDFGARASILAEHGFSSLITTVNHGEARSMVFDFGFGVDAAARNADLLHIDLTKAEAAALSHGHLDHFGGLEEMAKRIHPEGIDFVVHPAAFRKSRRIARGSGEILEMPSPVKEEIEKLGFRVVVTESPHGMLDGDVLFLGGIPRTTGFERGMPNATYDENGQEVPDDLKDDTSVVVNVKGRGLVVLSGCAHSGIINTVRYAIEVTGVQKVYAVMGGFHLNGPAFEPIIGETLVEMLQIAPDYVIPTHCTGRKAITAIENAMPDAFILNMSGTKLTFSA